MGWRHAVYHSLDRPVLRDLLAAAATGYASLRTGRLCRVYYDGTWVHEYPEGVFVEPKLLLSTPSEIEEKIKDQYMYHYTPRTGDVILDVGAATGWETLAFARRVGTEGRVVSIEANPRVYSYLRRMCVLNKLDNVIPLNCAAAASECIMHISDRQDFWANSVFEADADLRVRGRTLDEIVDTLHLDRVDLLKMNIEGAEGIAIEGMAKMILNTRCVCICCHDFLAQPTGPAELRTKSSVIAFLRQNNFDVSLRDSDRRPWISDCVYGRSPGADAEQVYDVGEQSARRSS